MEKRALLALGAAAVLACALLAWLIATDARRELPSRLREHADRGEEARVPSASPLEAGDEPRARDTPALDAPPTTVRVVGCDARPRARAEVEITSPERTERVLADDEGLLRVPGWASRATDAADAVRFLEGERLLERVAPSAAEGGLATLRVAPMLRGRLLSPVNPAWIARTRVVLVPDAWSGRVAKDPRLVLDEPSFVRPEVSASGEFEVCELEAGRWTLRAACADAIAAPIPVDVGRAGNARVELRLRPAGGFAVRLEDPEGGPPRLAERSWELSTWSGADLPGALVDAGWEVEMDGLVLGVLAGMNPELARANPGEWVWLFAGDTPLPPDARAVLRTDAAGYPRVTADVELQPPGGLQAFHALELERAGGEGTLVVRIAHRPACPMPSTLAMPPLRLALRNLEDDRVATFQLVLDGGEDEQTIEHVPAGRYRASGVELGRRLLPGSAQRELALAAGGTARLDLDAAPLACVAFLPETAPGVPYDGRLSVAVRGERTPRGQAVQLFQFRGPPYTLPFQPAGEFVADVTCAGGGPGARVRALCEPGRTAEIRVQLEPR